MSTGASIDDLKEVDDALTKVEAEIEEVQRRLKGPGLDEKTQDYLRKKKELLRKEKEQLRKELKEQRLVPGVRAPQGNVSESSSSKTPLCPPTPLFLFNQRSPRLVHIAQRIYPREIRSDGRICAV